MVFRLSLIVIRIYIYIFYRCYDKSNDRFYKMVLSLLHWRQEDRLRARKLPKRHCKIVSLHFNGSTSHFRYTCIRRPLIVSTSVRPSMWTRKLYIVRRRCCTANIVTVGGKSRSTKLCTCVHDFTQLQCIKDATVKDFPRTFATMFLGNSLPRNPV